MKNTTDSQETQVPPAASANEVRARNVLLVSLLRIGLNQTTPGLIEAADHLARLLDAGDKLAIEFVEIWENRRSTTDGTGV
jgi:hypothetical protein